MFWVNVHGLLLKIDRSLMLGTPATDELIAFMNGEFLPFREMRLPVFDLAVMQGASVTERLRTVKHEPYQVKQHLERLLESLRLVGWKTTFEISELNKVIRNICESNGRLIEPTMDLSVVVFISAGLSVGDANGLISKSEPTVCVYTSELPFSRWSPGYQSGIDLVVPDVRQIPRTSIDPRIKMRSRLHWQMADQIARQRSPGAMALLLDEHDHLTETSSGNLMLVKDGVVMTPCQDATLNGISQQNVVNLCEEIGVEVVFRNLTKLDLYQADEAFLTSSTYCVMPVATLNGQTIGVKTPGRLTSNLSELWSQKLGLDFVQQAVGR